MVLQGDFQISLVEADSRKPFKEHFADGNVYVEAEPDAEYLISIQRISETFPGPLVVGFSVDGKHLYDMTYGRASTDVEHVGLYAMQNGVETETALKFTKPRPVARGGRQQRSQRQSGLLMGKVQVEIYQGLFCGYSIPHDFQTSWNAPAIDMNVPGSLMNIKSLQSGQGSSSFTSYQNLVPREHYRAGARLGVVTLNYCSAPGLMHVGVLPKPPPGAYQRMLKAYTSSTEAASPTTKVPTVTPIRIKSFLGRVDELYDLTHLDDDEDE